MLCGFPGVINRLVVLGVDLIQVVVTLRAHAWERRDHQNTSLDHHDPIRPQLRVLTHSSISFARVLVYVSGPCQPDRSFYLPVALRVIGQIQRKSEAKARNSNSEVEIRCVTHTLTSQMWDPHFNITDVGPIL